MNESDEDKLQKIRDLAATQRAERIKTRVEISKGNITENNLTLYRKIALYLFCYGLIAVALYFGTVPFLSFISSNRPKNNDEIVYESETRKHAPTRKEVIEAQFSAFDGSHRKLEQFIKNRMNDPSSYEHVSTRYTDKGDYLIVVTKFRGTNGFGATVIDSAIAKTDVETGEIIDIVE